MFLAGRYVETNGIFLKLSLLILGILIMVNFLEMHCEMDFNWLCENICR